MPFKNQHPFYNAWKSMIARCSNPNAKAYKDYGNRGIIVCERWVVKAQGFKNFVADMGEKPQGYSLERIDNNGNYEPSNCKWASKTEQQRNQRTTRKITIEGKTYIAAELAEKYGFKTDTIMNRATFCKTFEQVVNQTRYVFTDGLTLGGKASGRAKKNTTHCKYGHEFTEQNISASKEGWRRCKKCHAIGQQKINKRNQEKKATDRLAKLITGV